MFVLGQPGRDRGLRGRGELSMLPSCLSPFVLSLFLDLDCHSDPSTLPGISKAAPMWEGPCRHDTHLASPFPRPLKRSVLFSDTVQGRNRRQGTYNASFGFPLEKELNGQCDRADFGTSRSSSDLSTAPNCHLA